MADAPPNALYGVSIVALSGIIGAGIGFACRGRIRFEVPAMAIATAAFVVSMEHSVGRFRWPLDYPLYTLLELVGLSGMICFVPMLIGARLSSYLRTRHSNL
jgi:hypothetical protein